MVPAAVAPSRHHLPRGWFLKGDGFGGKGGMQPRASWNRSAPALQALRGVYALQRHPPPPHCTAATHPMSPHQVSTPTPHPSKLPTRVDPAPHRTGGLHLPISHHVVPLPGSRGRAASRRGRFGDHGPPGWGRRGFATMGGSGEAGRAAGRVPSPASLRCAAAARSAEESR